MSHDAKVHRICDSVKARPPGKTIVTKRAKPTHQIRSTAWKKDCHEIDISDLTEIISVTRGKNRVGEDTMVAKCEGLVTINDLVKHVVPLGYVPEVVPEFPNFTVGGLVNGDGIQSSCFRYGLFSKSVVEVEVVLGNGDVRVVSRTVESELFESLVESYGTLAIVVCVTVALRPSLPFVRTRYVISHSLGDFVKYFDAAVRRQAVDFLEGVVFSRECYVTIESTFCPTSEGLTVYDAKPFDTDEGDEYFYQHITNHVVHGKQQSEDVMPTDSFLFRSFRGLYWIIECYVNSTFLSNQRWMRRYCDRKMKENYDRCGLQPAGVLTVEDLSRCLVNQDMGVLLCRLEEGIKWVQERLGVYPLWICPLVSPGQRDTFVCDIGIYGEPTVQPFYHQRVLKELQEFVDFPSLWGEGYLDTIALRNKWKPIREKYHAEGVFVPLDAKVSNKSTSTETGPIPHWRLVNQFGWWWQAKFAVAFSLVIAAMWITIRMFF